MSTKKEIQNGVNKIRGLPVVVPLAVGFASLNVARVGELLSAFDAFQTRGVPLEVRRNAEDEAVGDDAATADTAPPFA